MSFGNVNPMGHESRPEFCTFHALRIKGFATVDAVVEMTAIDADHVEGHLLQLEGRGHARFRERRSLWQLTPEGRVVHGDHLERDLQDAPLGPLAELYESFFARNRDVKEICTGWQVRDGSPNDHSDERYDRLVIERLEALHALADPVVREMGELLHRLGPYGPRLSGAFEQVLAGNTRQFTGVMCGSYHDVWMELHEDLILTQRIDRAAEGSY